jgi:TRAP-type C4-dicarboxylate transport system permease small subunit
MAGGVAALELAERRIGDWSRNVALLGVIALLVVSAGTLLDVLLRWIANSPIRGLNDINGLAAPIVIAACLPLVLAHRQNISIRFLGDWLGPRASLWLDAFGALLLFIFVALVAWQLTLYTAELWRAKRTTWQLLLPVAPWWTAACLLVLLCVPVQAAALATDIARAISGTPRPQTTHGEEGVV